MMIGVCLVIGLADTATAQTSRERADSMSDGQFLGMMSTFMCATLLDDIAQQARRDGRRIAERTDTRLVTTMTHGNARRFRMEVTCETERGRDGRLDVVQRHSFTPMR